MHFDLNIRQLASLILYGEMATLRMGSKTWVVLNTDRVVSKIIAKRTNERFHMPVASGTVSKAPDSPTIGPGLLDRSNTVQSKKFSTFVPPSSIVLMINNKSFSVNISIGTIDLVLRDTYNLIIAR